MEREYTEGETVLFRAIGPHGWQGRGTILSIHTVYTSDFTEVPVYLVLLEPGYAHDKDGRVAKEGQGIVLGAGEIL